MKHTNMGDYFEFVDNLAKKREDKLFLNSGPIHAAIVMSRIFEYSCSKVSIFSGGFTGEVSNDSTYLKSLESFLERDGTQLSVIVEDYESNKHSRVYNYFKEYNSKVELYQTSCKVRIKKNGPDNAPVFQDIHFTVGDDKMIRLETNPANFSAQVNFNTAKAKDYLSLFEDIRTTADRTSKIDL
jgi:hypothetical protein